MLEVFPARDEWRAALRWPSTYALFAVNLVPLGGVLLLGWSALTLLVLYWLENAVVGAYTGIKLGIVARGTGWKVFLIAFFCVHFGGFMAVHGVFILGLAGLAAQGLKGGAVDVERVVLEPLLRGWTIPATLLMLFASHGISFATNFLGRREYLALSDQEVMMVPYRRVVVMHLTLLFGGFVLLATRAPAGLAALLVLLKIAADLGAHVREHSPRPSTASPPT